MRATTKALRFLLPVCLAVAACSSTPGGQATSSPAGTAATNAPPATEPVSPAELTELRMIFCNNRAIQYHPYYLAKHLGYFEEEGLDITLKNVAGGGAGAEQLVANNVDVMVCGVAAPLNAIALGEDLVDYYDYFYRNINQIVVPEDSELTKLEDLEGKIIGISELSGGEVPLIRAAMGSIDSVENQDYRLLPIGDGGQVTFEALRTKKADAYSSTVYDIAALEGAGLKFRSLFPDTFTFLPNIGHIVTRETLTNRADDLTGFARAVSKGIVFAQANPDAAKAIVKTYAPELFEDAAVAEAMWATTELLMEPPAVMDSDLLGAHHVPGWEFYLSFASEGTAEEGALQGEIALDKVLDSTLLEAINDFDHSAIEDQARAYQP